MDEPLTVEEEAEAWRESQKTTFEGVLWVKNGKIVSVNRQFERIFRMSELDVAGLPWLNLIHPASRDAVKRSMEKLQKHLIGSFGGLEIALLHPLTGEKIPAVMSSFGIYDSKGDLKVLIKKLMREESPASDSYTRTTWMKWAVEKWPNIAAILAAVGGAAAVLWEKLSRL